MYKLPYMRRPSSATFYWGLKNLLNVIALDLGHSLQARAVQNEPHIIRNTHISVELVQPEITVGGLSTNFVLS
jgi:hypothetical protein